MPSIKSKIVFSEYDKYLKREKSLQGVTIEFGYPKKETHNASGNDIGGLALILERGTSNMPARPFVRNSAFLLMGMRGYSKNVRNGYMNYVFKNKDKDACFKAIGEAGASAIKKSIQSQNFAPLAKSTIRKKGFSTILIETKELFNKATYVIKRGYGNV